MTTLNAPGQINSYVTGAAGVAARWTAGNQAAAITDLGALCNARLTNAGVAKVSVATVTGLRDTRGTVASNMNGPSWSIQVSNEVLSWPATHANFIKLTGAMYHEARHAEQRFRIAQLTGPGKLLGSPHLSGRNLWDYLGMPQKKYAKASKTACPSDVNVYDVRDWAVSMSNPGNFAYCLKPEEIDAFATQNLVNAAMTHHGFPVLSDWQALTHIPTGRPLWLTRIDNLLTRWGTTPTTVVRQSVYAELDEGLGDDAVSLILFNLNDKYDFGRGGGSGCVMDLLKWSQTGTVPDFDLTITCT